MVTKKASFHLFHKKEKIPCILVQLVLLLWFLLDMTGFYIGEHCLVTKSYKEDGLFFLIYLVTILLFLLKESIGKWISTVWLGMWFLTQFISHEWYTIFQKGFMGTLESKFQNFSGNIQWLTIEGRYIPDLYHTILHGLILWALISTVMYIKKNNQH